MNNRISTIALSAQIRSLDKQIIECVNDNQKREKLIRDRHNAAHEVGKIYFSYRVEKALQQVAK